MLDECDSDRGLKFHESRGRTMHEAGDMMRARSGQVASQAGSMTPPPIRLLLQRGLAG